MLPIKGFYFDRPVVLLQSDDWGRVGVRDKEGFEQLRSAGIALGEQPYDLYSLETADDVDRLRRLLCQHRDSTGRNPCIGMNFIVANLDFANMAGREKNLPLLSLGDGLPQGWTRPQLLEGYRSGIQDRVFYPALHGTTHFCRSAVEAVEPGSERDQLIQKLWSAGTPYIHWRMPWIGFEYWNPNRNEDERFLDRALQRDLIGQAVGAFAKLFSSLPRSACAPGYRANDDTHRAWAQHGIGVAQNGPGSILPPHFGPHEMLHLSRTVEFEPAVDPKFSVELSLRQAERAFECGLPAIVSVHSINFHSTIRDFRSRTLQCLDEFLTALEAKHSDLLYLHDEDLLRMIKTGNCETPQGPLQVSIRKKQVLRSSGRPLEA